MLGYIIGITKCKNEDLIVRVLNENSVEDLYRFYGARHSIINIGNKIDYIKEQDAKFMPRLRKILHISAPWMFEYSSLYFWQEFIGLLNVHLKQASVLESFYFESLDKLSAKLQRQDPKRAILETYVSLLEQEGRLNIPNRCFVCESKIDKELSLARAFLVACPSCVGANIFGFDEIKEFFESKRTVFLNDEQVGKLYEILKLGM